MYFFNKKKLQVQPHGLSQHLLTPPTGGGGGNKTVVASCDCAHRPPPCHAENTTPTITGETM